MSGLACFQPVSSPFSYKHFCVHLTVSRDLGGRDGFTQPGVPGSYKHPLKLLFTVRELLRGLANGRCLLNYHSSANQVKEKRFSPFFRVCNWL